MKIGLFCGYDNPQYDYARCFADQTRLVIEAEALGFDEVWVGERHFNRDGVCASILVLLGYLAAATRRIRLGTAMLLLAFRDPIQAAEDIATLDHLSGGRLNLGVAKGGAFSTQSRHFGVDPDTTRSRALESVTLINRLLYEDEVRFAGEFFQVEGLSITPKPLQRPSIPVWIGTTSEEGIRYAAERGLGVMGPSRASVERVRGVIDAYRALVPSGDPKLNLARFYHSAPTHEEAVSDVRGFFKRATSRAQGVVQSEKLAYAPDPDDDALITRSLIGSYDEVREKIDELRRRLPIRSLLLAPACLDPDKISASLAGFAAHIRPRLAQDAVVRTAL